LESPPVAMLTQTSSLELMTRIILIQRGLSAYLQ
jgi:hypothetical protein